MKNWKIIVDKCTGKKWSDFTGTKIGMIECTCEFLNLMKTQNIPIKCIRLDPAGENSALKARVQSADWQSWQPIKFEFTSRETSQHSNLAKLAFPFLSGKAQAMMSAAFIPVESHGKVAIEALR